MFGGRNIVSVSVPGITGDCGARRNCPTIVSFRLARVLPCVGKEEITGGWKSIFRDVSSIAILMGRYYADDIII